MADGLKLKVVSSGLICVILFALAEPIAERLRRARADLAAARRGAGAVRPEHDGLLPTAFEAIGSVRLNLRLVFSECAVEAGASIALVLAGAGVVGAAFGRAIGYAFGTRAGAVPGAARRSARAASRCAAARPGGCARSRATPARC